MRTSVAGLVLTVALVGCAEDQPESAPEGIDVDVLPRLTLQEELRIGSLEDPDYGFSRIRGVDVDRDGQVYVFERQDREIRVYSPDGRLIRRIGGAGEGPGEFQRDVRFGVVGDVVWAMDWVFGSPVRLTRFNRSGDVLSARRVEGALIGRLGTLGAAFLAPAFVDAEGLFVSDFSPFIAFQLPGNPDSVRVPRVRFDDQGAIVDTVGWYTRLYSRPELTETIDVGASEYIVRPPPLAEPLEIIVADGRIRIDRPLARTATGGVFRVAHLGFSDDTIYARTFRYTPVPYQEEQLDRLAGAAARPFAGPVLVLIQPGETRRMLRRQQDSAGAHAAIRRAMRYPEFQLPVGGASHLGSDGSLWLRREDTGADTFRWIVLGVDGLPVGEVHLPREGFSIAWSDSETLWAIEPDQLGVPWLVRYRIVRGSER